MKEDKDQPRQVSTCLEDSAYAEKMQKIMGEQGIGSLCEERMRSLLKTRREVEEEPRKAKKAEGANDQAGRDRDDRAENPLDNGNQIKRRSDMIESIMNLHKCADCSIRCKAAQKPRSLYARIHRWHATWWPGWKFFQAELSARAAKAMPR